MNVATVLRNAVRRSRFPAFSQPIRLRPGPRRERRSATEWARCRAEDLDAWGTRCDPAIWREAVEFALALYAETRPAPHASRRPASAAGMAPGGPGLTELLYVLTRILRPATALETGVTAGWSTAAILAAMHTNGAGHLHSSALRPARRPAHRKSAGQHPGWAVPAELTARWRLHSAGAERDLEAICTPGTTIDLVHHHAGGTRNGRRRLIRRPGAVHLLVMDDVHDDLAFREYAERQPMTRVFACQGTYVGVTGPGLPIVEQLARERREHSAGHAAAR